MKSCNEIAKEQTKKMLETIEGMADRFCEESGSTPGARAAFVIGAMTTRYEQLLFRTLISQKESERMLGTLTWAIFPEELPG